MGPQHSAGQDQVDAELRKLFSGTLADTEEKIDVDERHRQWRAGYELRSASVGNPIEHPARGFGVVHRWPRPGALGLLGVATVGVLSLFAIQTFRPQQTNVVADEITFADSSPQLEAVEPDSSTTTAPGRSVLVVPQAPSSSTLLATSTSTSSSTTTQTSTTTEYSTTTEISTTTTPTSTSTEASTSSPTSTSSPVPTTNPPATSTPATSTPATTSPTSTSTPATTSPPSTDLVDKEMLVSVKARTPDGEEVEGTTLTSDNLLARLKNAAYLLPRQCQFVELHAPDGYLFHEGSKPPYRASKSVDICPSEEDPRNLTIETLVSLAD